MSSGNVVCIPDPFFTVQGSPVEYNYNSDCHTGSEVNHLAVSTDGKMLMSSSFDGTLCVWPTALSDMR
jgi:WD40 repeat protein